MRKNISVITAAILLFFANAAPAGFSSANFDGIGFKTRYEEVKIKTPVLVEMEEQSRVLKMTPLNPDGARFRFLVDITPSVFEFFKRSEKGGLKDQLFGHSGSAYFLLGKEKVKIGEITLDVENFGWIYKYEPIIRENFKSCILTGVTGGFPYLVCRPLLAEARIIRIERSTLSPALAPELVFPYLDYVDIFVEILKISPAPRGF